MIPNKFPFGQVVMTPGVQALFDEHDLHHVVATMKLLKRHGQCDWGEVCASDSQMNDAALTNGDRILSVYLLPEDCAPEAAQKVWVITEADRSYTTLLLPEEY